MQIVLITRPRPLPRPDNKVKDTGQRGANENLARTLLHLGLGSLLFSAPPFPADGPQFLPGGSLLFSTRPPGYLTAPLPPFTYPSPPPLPRPTFFVFPPAFSPFSRCPSSYLSPRLPPPAPLPTPGKEIIRQETTPQAALLGLSPGYNLLLVPRWPPPRRDFPRWPPPRYLPEQFSRRPVKAKFGRNQPPPPALGSPSSGQTSPTARLYNGPRPSFFPFPFPPFFPPVFFRPFFFFHRPPRGGGKKKKPRPTDHPHRYNATNHPPGPAPHFCHPPLEAVPPPESRPGAHPE